MGRLFTRSRDLGWLSLLLIGFLGRSLLRDSLGRGLLGRGFRPAGCFGRRLLCGGFPGAGRGGCCLLRRGLRAAGGFGGRRLSRWLSAPGVAVVAFCAGVFVRPAALAVVVLAAGFRAPGVAVVAFCAGVFLATAGLMEVRLAADRLPAAAFVAPPFLGACQPTAFAARPLTARVWLATLPSASFTLSMRRCLAITLLGPDRSSPTACASTSSAGDRLAEKTG